MQRWVQFKRKSCPQIARIMQLLSPLILTIISFLSEYDLSLYVCVQLWEEGESEMIHSNEDNEKGREGGLISRNLFVYIVGCSLN